MNYLKKYSIIVLLFVSVVTRSQVSVNINLGTPPPWGPVVHTEVRYYYLPDIEMYYDIRTAHFIYWHKGAWIQAALLPYWCSTYDLHKGYKVVIDNYFGPKPYIYYTSHKTKYPKGYKGPPPGQMKKLTGKPGQPSKAVRISSGGGNNKQGNASKAKGGNKSHGGGKGKH